MKTIILSFSYEWYPQLISGEKIYEHRKRFCNETVLAYIYLGLPYRQLVAVAEIGKRQELSDWLVEYGDDKKAVLRIKDYMSRNKYVMQVLNIQKIEPIDMRLVEQKYQGFRVPISYMYLDSKPEIFNHIKDNTVLIGEKIINDFTHISSDDICMC